jgi:hypothetical protein
MAKISFANPPVPQPAAAETPVVDVVVEAQPEVSQPKDIKEVSAAVVVVEPKPLAVPQASGPAVADGVEGEVSMSDIKLPRVNVVQKVGQLSDNFQPGSILFEKQVVLTTGKTPVDMTPIRIRKQYQRKVAWGSAASEEAPEVYDTVAEVRAAGGSLQFGDDNYFQEIAHIQLAIKLPEDVEGDEVIDLFPYQFGESLYAIAMWTVSSSGYTAVAKPLFTAAAGLLRGGLYHGHYNVTTEVRKNAQNSWYAPKLTFAGKHTPEAAEFFKSIAGI